MLELAFISEPSMMPMLGVVLICSYETMAKVVIIEIV